MPRRKRAAARSFPPPPAHQRFQERPSSPWVWCFAAAGGGGDHYHLLLPASTSLGHCSRESVHVGSLNARLEAAEHFEDCEASTDAADLVLVELMEFASDPAVFDSVEAREVVVVVAMR